MFLIVSWMDFFWIVPVKTRKSYHICELLMQDNLTQLLAPLAGYFLLYTDF